MTGFLFGCTTRGKMRREHVSAKRHVGNMCLKTPTGMMPTPAHGDDSLGEFG